MRNTQATRNQMIAAKSFSDQEPRKQVFLLTRTLMDILDIPFDWLEIAT
jgi:hypothetical protein